MAEGPPPADTKRPASESLATSAVLVAMTALAALSIDITLPSLPAIQRALGADVATTQLTLSVFFAGFAVGQLAMGPLSDRFGRRPVVLAGLAGYALASVACALATTIELLIAARLVQSICACAGPVLARAIVRDIYGPERAARMLANIMAVFAMVPAGAPILGGFIDVTLGWRWNFGFVALYGAAVVALIYLKIPETNRYRTPAALAPRNFVGNYRILLSSRIFVGYALTSAFTTGGLLAFISGSAFVLIDVYGVPSHYFGFFFGAVAIGVLIGSRIVALTTARRGIPATVRLGLGFTLAGGTAMAAIALSGVPAHGLGAAVAVVLAQLCYMVGLGTIMPAGTAGAIGPYPQMAGAASALVGFGQMGMGALTGIAVGHLFNGTALPMALMILACALAARACFRLVRVQS